MKIGFIYNAPFNIISAIQQPVTDAKLAVSSLAIELSKIGHDITVFSNTDSVADAMGVRNRNINITTGALNIDKIILETDFQAIVIVNDSANFIRNLKQVLPYTPKFYLWTNFDYSAPANKAFTDASAIELLEKVICVSDWQSERMYTNLKITQRKLAVLRYAPADCYENLYLDAKEFINQKAKALSLAYLGRPEDGLEQLMDLYTEICYNFEDINLNIYCDLSTMPNLAQRVQQSKHIEHVGLLNQHDLTQHLRKNNILAYPSTKEDTSNVFLSEAMAAGLYVVSSRVGAISEYCFGLGKQISPRNLEGDSLNSFTGELLIVCQTLLHSPGAFFDYCYKQVLEVNRHQTWRVRAREFLEILEPPD